MKVLVTGASGFIGGRLRTSLGMEEPVRLLSRKHSAIPEVAKGDLLKPASLSAACDGVESIFHCAGYAHAFMSSDPDAHWRINFEGTRNLLEAAGRTGVQRFVFLSSVKAMAESGDECVDENWPGEPVTPYGRAKRAAEAAVLEAGEKYSMHVVNLRLAMVYGRGGRGNLDRMARGIRAGWFPPLPETGNRRSLVHVDDVVEVMRLVANRPEAHGRTYIVADSRPYSSREIYDALRAALQKPALHWSVPAAFFRVAGSMSRQCAEIVERLLGSACYVPTRIERELGWRARVGLMEGLREMVGGIR